MIENRAMRFEKKGTNRVMRTERQEEY